MPPQPQPSNVYPYFDWDPQGITRSNPSRLDLSGEQLDTDIMQTTLKASEAKRRLEGERLEVTNAQATYSSIEADSWKSGSLLNLTHILSQNILLHPFIVLRRSCQVNRKCPSFMCCQPFFMLPFLYHQQRKQGFSALYKGLSSELLVKGITLGTETALANYTEWPREVGSKRYLEDSVKVLLLRGLSVAITTPLLCSAVIQTVQSVIIVRDRPSFVDCLKDGFFRLLHITSTPSTRMLPIGLLVVPTVIYYVSHLALWHVTKTSVEFFKRSLISTPINRIKSRMSRQPYQTSTKNLSMADSVWQQDLTLTFDTAETSLSVNNIDLDSEQISNSIIASLVADVALLPVETVLNSLYIQGTRTIIDNCDETTVVLPVLTNYDGFNDCYQSILRFEGNFGLYKGLGAIILQYSVHYLIIRSLYYLLREFQFGSRASEGNAHKRRQKRSDLEQLRPTRKEFNRIFSDNYRHSTPNNPTEFNRLNDVGDNLLGSTPQRFDPLPASSVIETPDWLSKGDISG